MFLIQKLFRLLNVDRVTSVEIRQTQVVSLESLDLMLQFLLKWALLGQSEITNFQ